HRRTFVLGAVGVGEVEHFDILIARGGFGGRELVVRGQGLLPRDRARLGVGVVLDDARGGAVSGFHRRVVRDDDDRGGDVLPRLLEAFHGVTGPLPLRPVGGDDEVGVNVLKALHRLLVGLLARVATGHVLIGLVRVDSSVRDAVRYETDVCVYR